MALPDLLWPLVLAIGCAQGMFLGLVLLRLDSRNRAAVSALALLVVCCALMLGEEWVDAMELYRQAPHLLYSTMLVPLLIGPLFLIHTQTLAEGKQRLTWKDALHGGPFVVALLYFAPLYLLSGEAKLSGVQLEGYRTDIMVWAYLKGVHMIVYLVLALRMLNRALRQKRAEAKPSQAIAYLLWPRRILWTVLAGAVGVYGLLTLMLLGVEGLVDSDRFGGLMLTGIIYVQAFVAIKHPPSLRGPWRAGGGPRADEPRPKYAKSRLSASEKRAILHQLRICMEQQRSYRNPTIRLETVAEAVACSTHRVSQVINEEAGTSFRAFINTYRVEEVKQALVDPSKAHLSLLALAFDAGFSSKASFNRVFKQHTGVTPTAYREHARAAA